MDSGTNLGGFWEDFASQVGAKLGQDATKLGQVGDKLDQVGEWMMLLYVKIARQQFWWVFTVEQEREPSPRSTAARPDQTRAAAVCSYSHHHRHRHLAQFSNFETENVTVKLQNRVNILEIILCDYLRNRSVFSALARWEKVLRLSDFAQERYWQLFNVFQHMASWYHE